MPNFNSLEALETFLFLKVQKAMATTVASEVKQLESDNVKEVVYSQYDPKQYIRREDNGGLSDVQNMKSETFQGGNTVVLNVENNTLSNQNYNPNNKDPFALAGLVEYGSGSIYGEYDYIGSPDYLRPRPFIEKTKHDLQNGKAKEILVKALINEGISSM